MPVAATGRRPTAPRAVRAAASLLAALVLLGVSGCSGDNRTAGSTATPSPGAGPTTVRRAAPASPTIASTAAPTPVDVGNDVVAAIAVPDLSALPALGAGEGELNLVAWAGYTENDWVVPFERASSCKVHVETATTSNDLIRLMKSGQYDGVSASGDVTLRLIASGDVAPVNTDLVPNYTDVFAGLKNRRWNSVGGQAYGIPQGRAANILMYNTTVVKPAPDSWGVVFDPSSPYKGTITAYDSPIYLADAALYIMATDPALAITNPYALDERQFAAAVDLLSQQRPFIGEYWSDYTKEQAAFKSGALVVGTTWQVIANGAKLEGAPVETVFPKEGATGWSDTWMVAAKAKHPNCMYLWMNHIISPEVNAQVAEFYGEAQANRLSCAKTKDPTFCATFHAADETYFAKVWFWTTPTKTCHDGRGDICKDDADWNKAWTTIRR